MPLNHPICLGVHVQVTKQGQSFASPFTHIKDGKIIGQSREIIKEIDMNFVRKLRTMEAAMKSLMHSLKEPSSEIIVPFGFVSLCRLPFYETDFGWGKPTWVGSDHIPVPNYVCIFDGKDEKSIQVYATLKDKDMPDFKKDAEILTYTVATYATSWFSC